MQKEQVTFSNCQEAGNLQWVQLNVGLIRQAGGALMSARALFAQITPVVMQWRHSGWLQCFFFMRKPPDVRLRFLMTAHKQAGLAELSQQMSFLQEQGWIKEFFFSNYQAEITRFGGSEAMNYVHNYFDEDTAIWLVRDRLSQQQSVITPEILLPIVFHDLFRRALIEDIAILRCWCILGSLTPFSPEAVILDIALFSIDALCRERNVDIEEARLLSRYAAANEKLARALTELDRIHQPTYDLCSVLATVALFNFNRHGFDGQRSSVLVEAMIRTLKSNGT
jgi:thiopeptide-type bacteriocin biosynthesis protein